MNSNPSGTSFKDKLKQIVVEFLSQAINYIIILFLGLIVGAVVIALSGKDPIAAYASLWAGAFGNWYKFADTLDRSAIMILSGLAAAVAFRTSEFNLGLEGQLYIGAFAASWVGFSVHGLPAVIHIPLCLIAGMLAGALWTLPAVYLRLKWLVPVMVPTLMLNYIAILFTQYLVVFPYNDPTKNAVGSPMLDASARLPKLVTGSTLNLGFIIAIVMSVIVYWFIFKTKTGYELRMVGYNPSFSAASGLPVNRSVFLAMTISGALVGLGGATVIMGFFGRFVDGFSVGYGWDGMMISLFAQNHPFGVLPASIFYAALANGALNMTSRTGVPQAVVDMVKGTIFFFVTAQLLLTYFRGRLQKWLKRSAN